MFAKLTHKKTVIILVALCLCLTFVLGACNSTKAFTPVKTDKGEVSGNGGIAVRYGDYIFYVNGYQSDATAANDYSDAIRVGSIVRISVADLETAIGKTEQTNKTTSVIASEIANFIAGEDKGHGAVTVVPNVYYSANTTETGLNGIYIFNDRLYFTTPNDELTASGDKLTSQLVLKSIDLTNPESTAVRHFVFTANTAQILLAEVDNKVVATYILNSKFYTLDVAAGTSTEIKSLDKDEKTEEYKDLTVNNVNYDKNSNGEYAGLFFTDADGSICHIATGASTYQVYVTNPKSEDGHNHNSLAIKSVNDGYVYYTVTDENGTKADIYFTNKAVTDGNHAVFCKGAASGSITYYGYQDKVIYLPDAETDGSQSYYNILVSDSQGNNQTKLLVPVYNVYSITIDRVEGKFLYYTANGINYKLDVVAASQTAVQHGEIIGKGISTTATGWSKPDALSFTIGDTTYNYVFSLASGSVSVVKFDAATKKNSTSATITLTEISED